MASMEFTIDLNFQPHYGPGVNSAPNRDENNGYLQWGKGGRCIVLTTLQLHVLADWKFGGLNLLEPSWAVQAFTVVALSL